MTPQILARQLRRAFVGCCLLLTGCSIPEAIDPRQLFDDDVPPPASTDAADARASAEAQTVAAAGEPYPALSTVPERPTPPTAREIRDRVVEGLISDRQNARYTDEAVRREGLETAATDQVSGPAAPQAEPATLVEVEKIPAEPPEAPVIAAEVSGPDTPPIPPSPKEEPPAAIAEVLPASAREPQQLASTATEPVPRSAEPPAAPEQPLSNPAKDIGTAPAAEVQVAIIQFGVNSSALNDVDRDILRQVATVALNAGAAVKVVGHSSGRTGGPDSVRRELANLDASIRRANAVAMALVDLGVDPAKLIVEAKSDHEPMYDESAPTGEAGNRRAEVFLIR